MRAPDDEVVDLVDALGWQQAYVESVGSPTAALILAAVVEDLLEGGRLSTVLPERVRFGDLPGLRVMAAVHRLALERRAPAVALFLPTLGGTAPRTTDEQAAFRREVVALLVAEADAVVESLGRTPQTNETGRAVLLRCALSRLDDRPVRLHEIGASAGLNLRADHLPGEAALEAGPMPPVVERVGCDRDPVDPTSPEGRALLSSYVWVDDVGRFRRLARAMEVARRVPAEVRRQDAVDFLRDIDLQAGTATVVWHSALWVYLAEEVRDEVMDAIAVIGGRAGHDRPVVHVSWEWDSALVTGSPDDASFLLCVRRWDGGPDDGRPRLLARGRSHGRDVCLVEDEHLLVRDPLLRVG